MDGSKKKLLCFAVIWLAVSGTLAATVSDVAPVGLRCEYAIDPLGVDVASPRLFWRIESRTRGQRQTAYQVIVSSTPEKLASHVGDLWDSGRVRSDATTQIRYAGRPLKSSQQVFWKVRVWDKSGRVSPWSQPASFTLGVLTDKDWLGARWIGETQTNAATTLLRREFTVKPGLRRAVAHVCGLGQYELTVNGAKAGDDVLSPGWTAYDKTCLYETRDLTSLLREGDNVLGIELANGMYSVPGGRYVKFKGSFGPRKAIALVRLEYADGSVESIITDEHWKIHNGPVTFSCAYGGEDFDARLVQPGWDTPEFDARDWASANLLTGPGGKLRGLSAAAPSLKTFEVLAPKSVNQISNGVSVYDFGQNAPLMPRLRVSGPAGSTVRITPSELIHSDGSADRGSVGRGRAYWQYTLSGAGEETWFPKFFYHGSRYFQVELKPAAPGGDLPRVENLEGVVMHSSSAPVGEFECSNELFNRIHALVRWAQRANMMSLLTDCPHRERLGWLEQYHLNGPSLRYEFDLAQLFTKGMNDMADAQLTNGLVPNHAPEYVVFKPASYDPSGAFRDSPEWGSAVVLVPWQQYQFEGDVELLRRHYDAMKRYVAYLGSRGTNHIVNHGLGDWYDIGPKPPGFAQLTPRALTATAFYYQDVRVLAQVAELLGRRREAKEFTRLAADIRNAFNREFYNPTNHSYATGSQTANAIPLVMGLCEATNRAAVLESLVQDVQARGNAVTAGDVGYRYVLRALADGGRSGVIFEMNNQSEKPGYGYQLAKGATSLTEAWDARRESSQNHFMLGQIMEWFYADLAGIAPDPSGPGFKKVKIQPSVVGDLTHVKAAYNSRQGRIESKWRRDGNQFTLRVVIPPNSTATVFVPSAPATVVRERGRAADKSVGVRFLRRESNAAVYAVESGEYEFQSEL